MSGSKKKSSGDAQETAEKHKAIIMETIKIIERLDQGKEMVHISYSYNMNHSSIGGFLENKDKIMEHVSLLCQ